MRNFSDGLESRISGKRLTGEIIGRVAIQRHRSDPFDRYEFLRDQFRTVEKIEGEVVFVFLRDELHSELPLRVASSFDSSVAK